MAYCTKCGERANEGAKFCANCGTPITQNIPANSEKRNTIYDGEMHKCPYCNEILSSYITVCPSCGNEIRDGKVSAAISNLSEKLSELEKERNDSPLKKMANRYLGKMGFGELGFVDSVDAKKIDLITNYPIPNTKEDIIEFMILATSNFDYDYYNDHLDEKDISDAWMAKIKQCYRKAELTFGEDPDFEKVQSMYDKALHKDKKTDFASWSVPAKIAWGYINICTLGIPEIIRSSNNAKKNKRK